MKNKTSQSHRGRLHGTTKVIMNSVTVTSNVAMETETDQQVEAVLANSSSLSPPIKILKTSELRLELRSSFTASLFLLY